MQKDNKSRVNREDLISAIADDSDLDKKTVNKVLTSFTEVITNFLCAGVQVSISRFGVFCVLERKASVACNPQNGARMQIDAHNVAKFRASKNLKDAVRNIKK